MKTSFVQGKAPSGAAVNAAEVSSCLLIINASSSRETSCSKASQHMHQTAGTVIIDNGWEGKLP